MPPLVQSASFAKRIVSPGNHTWSEVWSRVRLPPAPEGRMGHCCLSKNQEFSERQGLSQNTTCELYRGELGYCLQKRRYQILEVKISDTNFQCCKNKRLCVS